MIRALTLAGGRRVLVRSEFIAFAYLALPHESVRDGLTNINVNGLTLFVQESPEEVMRDEALGKWKTKGK